MCLLKVQEKRNPFHIVSPDVMLARVLTEKRLALIKAWEESEKTKAENRQVVILNNQEITIDDKSSCI